MTKQNQNRGIIMSGGTINAGQIAVGDQASNVQHASFDPAQLALAIQAIDAFRAALGVQVSALPEGGEAVAAADALATELKQKNPDRSRISGLLGTLTEIGKAAPGLATLATMAVNAVKLLL